VPIGRRMHDGLGRDIAAGARAILDDELLAKPLGQPLSYEARQDVGRATSPKADDDANRPRRIACAKAKREAAGSETAPAVRYKKRLRGSVMRPSRRGLQPEISSACPRMTRALSEQSLVP